MYMYITYLQRNPVGPHLISAPPGAPSGSSFCASHHPPEKGLSPLWSLTPSLFLALCEPPCLCKKCWLLPVTQSKSLGNHEASTSKWPWHCTEIVLLPSSHVHARPAGRLLPSAPL